MIDDEPRPVWMSPLITWYPGEKEKQKKNTRSSSHHPLTVFRAGTNNRVNSALLCIEREINPLVLPDYLTEHLAPLSAVFMVLLLGLLYFSNFPFELSFQVL